ncbi:actin-associated protein FAM107A [Thunnus albacares]|uniref:actin-associated protein FAM107A n=1 Tax=Thunnus albacares TaxID=8236 RepID=UPI001C4C3DF9|nr:actin-associated protein FAM107A isoform X2 [Thunnus maccoyii]XP_044208279.1 actin-associated protein FAM107A [Thunnus albacares]XP_044208280.1 actin-associated protein FAM107A [Thunnus albacares]
MSLNGSFPNDNNQAHVEIQPVSRDRMINSTHPQNNSHRRDNRVRAEASSGQSNPIKASRTHNELHKELLLAHKRGLVLSSRSELQQVLERRKRVQTGREEEGHTRTPLEDELFRRQQKQLQRQNEQEEKTPEEAQLMEFVRVRQNLRKIHSVIQNKAANS